MIDLEDGTGVTLFEGQYYKSDLDDGTITLQDIKDEAGTEKVMDVKLYRAGKLGGRLESWTQNSGGAVINNHSGQTFSGKLHERCWIDLKKEGYSILAGPTRMMGSPGESEITLIKLDKS